VAQLIQLLLAAHGLRAAAGGWLALTLLGVLTLHAIARLLRAALALRNDWITRPRL
jgi:hypothetical protein